MPVRSAVLALVLALVAATLGGCVAQDEMNSFTFAAPTLGEIAVYDAILKGYDYPVTLRMEVGGLTKVADAMGEPRILLALQHEVTIFADGVEGGSEITTYVDGLGQRALVFVPCWGFGTFEPRNECSRPDRASASWLEYGLPAALGVAPWWGRALDEPTASLTYGYLGRTEEVTFAVSGAGDSGDQCRQLSRHSNESVGLSPYVSLFSAPPVLLEVCEGKSFPTRAVLADESELVLRAHQPGSETLANPEVATNPWQQRAPNAERVSGVSPKLAESDDSGFPTAELLEYLRNSDDSTRTYLASHADAKIRSSFGLLHGVATVAGLNDKLIAPPNTTSEAEREVVFESRSGALLQVRAQKQCRLDLCNITVESVQELEGVPLAAEQLHAIPESDAILLGKRLLGPLEMTGFVLKPVGAPAPAGDRYFFRYFGQTDFEMGYPAELYLDGSTGRVAWIDADRAVVEELTRP